MDEHLKAILDHQYLMLQPILTTINKNTFLKHPADDKWSVFENIAHLGRYNEIFLERMHAIQLKNNPSFERYVADNEPGFIEWCNRSFDVVIAGYYSSRKNIIEYFESLSDENLTRTGMHPKYGELNVTEWLHFYLLHEAHHFFTIFKLLHS